MKILVLNSGSSSQKSAVFDLGQNSSPDPIAPLWEGKLEWDGDHETLTIRNSNGKKHTAQSDNAVNHQASVKRMLDHLTTGPTAILKSLSEIAIAGHRIVHGGPKLTLTARITSEVKREIENVASIAPLHNQAGLEGIELIENLLPQVPQIAVFDTGFHRSLPLAAQVYAGPYQWYEHNIRRYGFHGINHEYCAQRAAQLLGHEPSSLKIISCHLGNGCSLAAIDGGQSVDTTMGFTPLEGLMMGTRSGSIDPGILTHLMRTGAAKPADLDKILNRESGLLGISGVSSDMRDVLAATHKGNQRAKLAFDIFVHRLQSEIGAMAASLGGIDVLVFTAGIGENSSEVRRATCARLKFLGTELDNAANTSAKPDADISLPNSRIRVLVIRAQEDWAIARQCFNMASSAQR